MAGIFISYRRDDAAGQVGRLFGRLSQHYGEDFVFMDVESINPSQQFETVIEDRIKNCDVMLIAIGPRWVADRGASQADTKDFVRLEIATALAAKRAICPMLIDRREAIDPNMLPAEFREVLGRQISEIRHSTFDRDVDALIDGLTRQGIRPPPAVRRVRFHEALAAAGGPFAWFGAASRWLGPFGALALLGLILAGAGGWVYHRAYGQGFTAGTADVQDAIAKRESEITTTYELGINKQQRESLKILGSVTDGAQGIEDAQVKLTNLSNDKTETTTTDSRGIYLVNLETIEIAEGDTVRVEVTKPSYRPTRELVKYHDGFREFRAVLRK